MTIPWKTGAAIVAVAGAANAADSTVQVKVDSWHSKGDAYKAEAALRAIKGVKSASGDFASKQLTVVFDSAVTSEAAVRKAIADSGF